MHKNQNFTLQCESSNHIFTCRKSDIPRRMAVTASRALLVPPVKASQIEETEGRNNLLVKVGAELRRLWTVLGRKKKRLSE